MPPFYSEKSKDGTVHRHTAMYKCSYRRRMCTWIHVLPIINWFYAESSVLEDGVSVTIPPVSVCDKAAAQGVLNPLQRLISATRRHSRQKHQTASLQLLL